MTSTLTYTQQLNTLAKHIKSGKTVETDAPTDNHGKGEAFSPTDLLATSLGACMITVMGIAAGENEYLFAKSEVRITKVMGDAPRRVSEIHVELLLPNVFNSDERIRLEKVGLNCPVAKSLHPDLKQEVKFLWGAF